MLAKIIYIGLLLSMIVGVSLSCFGEGPTPNSFMDWPMFIIGGMLAGALVYAAFLCLCVFLWYGFILFF